jgi:hypothetical protein
MPYREPPEPKKPVVLVYGPFRLAWVRLSLAAIVLIAIVGSLRGLAAGHLDCDQKECALEVGWWTRHFALNDLVDLRISTSQLHSSYVTSRGGSYSSSSVKVFIPEVELKSGTFALFEMDEEAATRLVHDLDAFLEDPSAPPLSLTFRPTVGGPVLQLIFFIPLVILLLVSGIRGGGGTVELNLHGDDLTIQRRWGPLGGRTRRLSARTVRGVEIEYRGRRGQVALLTRDGHEVSLTDRFLAAADPMEHEAIAQELRVALACALMPEEPGAPPSPGPVTWSAFAGGMLGVPLGLALCGAIDLLVNGVGGSLQPRVALVLGCLAVGVALGIGAGIRRMR